MERSREKAQLEIVLQHFVIPARALAEGNWQMMYAIGMDDCNHIIAFELCTQWFSIVLEVAHARLCKYTVSSSCLCVRTWLTSMPQMDLDTSCPKPVWRVMSVLPTHDSVEWICRVLLSTTFPAERGLPNAIRATPWDIFLGTNFTPTFVLGGRSGNNKVHKSLSMLLDKFLEVVPLCLHSEVEHPKHHVGK